MRPGGAAVGLKRGEAVIGAKYESLGRTFSVLVLEDGSFKFTGRVAEDLASPVGILGATVEVVSGTGTGLETTTTDFSGNYVLYGVAGDIRLRASAIGYEPTTVDAKVNGGNVSFRGIQLVPATGQPGQLDGRWTLTLTAAPSCAGLPDSARSRQFIANISHTGTPRVGVSLSSPSVAISSPLVGQVAGDEITLPIYYWPGDVVDDPFYLLVDSIQPRGALGIHGTLRMTVNGASASGELAGGLEYYPNYPRFNNAMSCDGRMPVTLQREGR
jgi:hypothetical protein